MAHPLPFSQAPLPLPLPLPSSKLLHHNTPIFTHLKKPTKFTSISTKFSSFTLLRAIQDSNPNTSSSETEPNPPPESAGEQVSGGGGEEGLSEVGAEIKKMMKEREEKEPDFWSGVAEEIREIEWPAFGKVLSTTGVVIGVIAGSSVVLLTVNAVLAELSDRVFAGKGVQDFFG